MRTDIQAKLRKLKKASAILRTMCSIACALVALAGIFLVVCLTIGVGDVNYDNMIFGTAEFSLGHRLVLGAICALAFGALFKIFYHLHGLFGNYTRGEIFTRESVSQLRQFGVACLLWGAMNLVWALSLVLSVHPAKSFHGHADSLAIGAIIIVIAWFMDMAVDLREENELTI